MLNNLPLLSLCWLWPLLAALLLVLIRETEWLKRWLLLAALIELLLTLLVVWQFNPADAGWQLQEQRLWISSLNIHYQLAVDGISVGFLPATALLTLMVVLAGWHAEPRLPRLHFGLLLALQAATVGVFIATDLVLFFVFWELTLPPIALLIGLWGQGSERLFAASLYTLTMLAGGVLLLFAIVLLAINHADLHQGALSFSLPDLLATPLTLARQHWLFGLLFLGFAVKAPLPPFHSWLPVVAMQGPTQLTAVLLGLKLGLYGLIRFAIPLAPQAAEQHSDALAVLGVVTLVYAALLALRQTNLRSLLAYASISHVGLVLLALAAFNQQAMQGAVMQLLNFALIAASLMLLAGMLYQRFGSNDLLHLGGLAKPLPRMATLFFALVFAGLGIPGSSGFVAELLMLLGIAQDFPVLAAVVLFSALLAAAYWLNYLQQAFWGPLKQPALAATGDLLPNEAALLSIALLLILLGGLLPQLLLTTQAPAIAAWLQLIKL